tara:strand:- start:163 stop:759 length:597 start_codon:yes stop_codon:yes gene_type:complete
MLHDIFCTPIDEVKIRDTNFVKSVYDLYMDCKKNNYFKNNWMPDNDTCPTTFKHSDNILQDYDYIKKYIEINSANYLDNVYVNFSEIKLYNSWFNEQSKGQLVGTHNHRNPDKPKSISGVYYVKSINDEKQGMIKFKSNDPFNFEFPSDADNLKYKSSVVFKAIENTMLFFPSTISHSVTTNETDYDRVVLSFNLEYS